jgi:hypothetical protein
MNKPGWRKVVKSDAPFVARRVGTTGHEIITPQGTVVAWAVDATWAAILVAVLNKAEPRTIALFSEEIYGYEHDNNDSMRRPPASTCFDGLHSFG